MRAVSAIGRQNGVDLFGNRDGDADRHVGIQCKLKSEGHALSEDEVRGEVKKALTFKPPLKEYYVTTTAPNDVAMQELAREITRELEAGNETLAAELLPRLRRAEVPLLRGAGRLATGRRAV